MARTLDKTRKQISKKKGALGALHEGSRDSQRLRKAIIRDERLEKLASTRRKQERPIADRVAFFQGLLAEKGKTAFTEDEVKDAAQSFVHQLDEELAACKQARRPGRPPSSREDLLKMRIAAREKEHKTGFLMPDLTSQDNVLLLERWDGSWSQLNSLQWVRVTDAGAVRPGTFPPNKD